ncbi:hypothetical protein BV20DRAFT_941450 [Pilatotrama ljubarskyi]|nr:hypothetical protein BV20DRAFT_941450 [Pilatotrama ljubarskyi]
MADISSAASTLAVSDDHPLALELTSLRAAVSRYQASHATSLKLQRHSLEASQAVEHAHALERENTRLKEEVAVLRAHPDTCPTQATFQVPELTLALRRLSDKLTAVEETLLTRTKELADVRSELANAQHEIEAARALAADARAREEEGLARERELERKLKAAEEERRMADLVVQEYAALVRKLEGRARVPSTSTASSKSSVDLQSPSNGSTATLVDSLAEGKSGLHRLLEEFNGQNERLEAEIAKLHGDNGLLYKELEVARLGAEHDRSELAKARHELDKYHADDSTAVKMVSRYMSFSQSSTDTLQKAMDALRARHTATLATYNAEIAHLQRALDRERTESERIRSALDELTEDIAREAYGRRREVSLRLAFLGREENLAESLRRWIRRTRESLDRSSGDSGDSELDAMVLREAFARAVLDAEALLETLNGQPSPENGESSSGSIARLILAQDAVSSLTHELQEETVRRLKTERKLARLNSLERSEDAPSQQTAKTVVQPVPRRVSLGNPEKPLLAKSASSSRPASPPVPSPQENISATDAPSAGISIDEIIIVPSLDVPSESAVKRSRGSAAAIDPTAQRSPSHTTLSTDSQSASGAPSPVAAQPSPFSRPTPASPHVPAPIATNPHPDDTPVISFPSTEIPSNTASPSATTSASPVPFPHSSEKSHGPTSLPSTSTKPQDIPRAAKAAVPPPLQLDATDGAALSPLPSGHASPSPTVHRTPEAALLADLAQVKHRYDDVQRGFRDCHLALKELKRSLSDLPSPAAGPAADMRALLRRAVDRLSDFNEDARVELEIRIADEERVASGYEALLSIPGAMSPSDDSESADSSAEMLEEIGAFVDGTDRAVAKATQSFSQKLDDLEHDIASIKRTLHELALSSPEDAQALSATSLSARPSASPKWSAWTPNFLSPPRSTSPAPTFGSVMTSPRLRRSSSSIHPRDPSGESPTDPLAGLGLRIAVPSPLRSPTQGGLGAGAGVGGPQRTGPRQRTTSGMFMLGLGVRSASFGSSLGVHASASASKSSLASVGASTSTSRLANTVKSPRNEGSEGEEEDADSDVE